MKKFFQEIKADIKFKSAGPGQKLTESVGERAPRGKPNQPALQQPRQGPTSEAQMAAAAALARLEQKQPRARGPTSQESIRNQVRKELQAEATVSGSPEAPGTNKVPEPREEGSTHLAVPAVCFTCPLTGATLRKDQRDAHIKEAILSHFSTDPVAASIMKIHTFNRDRDRVKLGVDTIAKYLDNICLHPEEEKYRKIKLQNRVFQERINCLEGTHEFFEAVGFQKALLPVPDQEGPEEFYVLSEAALAQPQSLRKHKEQLLVAEPVRATLARQRRVFQPSPLASQFDLPGDFFNLTAEEVKREQRLRSEAVERLSVLRTKAMREREEQRERRRYTYTLLRVRFPDGCLLQGTFYARERVAALYAFVREALQSDWLPFELLASGGQRLSEEESPAFDECGLVPSALLTFSWDAALLEDLRAAGAEPDSSILKPELLSTIEKLS
ncbi:UBX domain-containing protein 6 isoform X2 [Prionailurus viverrinus]|uniref:UBX domain-containing protein 6 isoform X3 n=1 Tax=Prionailurus bengalensis TaxID=37029 RepID=UPI001CA873F7|nr:UBX domain-containing protein 6 isoform X3 [Prionailurus bengalensis]XP_047706218.1 UBX domain-containing protein 6 isoform X2 [Prionailurus viverrinus]